MRGVRFDFLRNPPDRVGGLIATLGLSLGTLYKPGDMPLMGWAPTPSPPSATPPPPLSADVATMGVHFPWDPQHERPIESAATVAGKPILEYWIRFTRGRADAEAVLLDAFGEPQAINERRRYGLYFVDESDTDWFTLEWYKTEPHWAKSSADPDLRRRQLRELVAAGKPGRFEFSPPMPASDFVDALGIADPIVTANDMNMTNWRLDYSAGGVRAVAWLENWPSGEPLPGYGLRRIGAGDEVRWVDVIAE